MSKIEEWKDIEGYSNYQVSNFGRVKSLKFGKEKILKLCKNKKGYLNVGLLKNGIRKTFTVHKLVALAFISNPNNLPQVNHKNEIKTDNRIENLEWVSPKENVNYGTRNERASEARKGLHRTEETKQKMSKPIIQYTKEGVFIRYWGSAKSASTELKISNGSITKCCKGKLKTCGGFIWKYKE